MAKRGGKMKTSTKVLLGAGGVAALGGLGYYFWSRHKKKLLEEAERVEDQVAAETETDPFTAEKNNSDTVPPTTEEKRFGKGESHGSRVHAEVANRAVAATRVSTFKTGSTTPVKVVFEIKAPRATIHYDVEYYKGNPTARLHEFYKNGEILSFKQAQSVLWGQSVNDGPPSQMTIKVGGVDVPVQSPRPPSVIYYKKVAPNDQMFQIMKLPASMHPTFESLVTHSGFKRVVVAEHPIGSSGSHRAAFGSGGSAPTGGGGIAWFDSQYVELMLEPGSYIVLAPMTINVTNEPFRYLKGYWAWTDHGPRTKSCADQRYRLMHNQGTGGYTLSFGRTVSFDSWDDLAFTLDVSDKPKSVSFRPMFDIRISHMSYYKTDYSERINRYVGVINAIPVKWFKSVVNTVAGWFGC